MAANIDRMDAHAEVFRGLVPTVIKDSLPLLSSPDDPRNWQPHQLLPDIARDGVSGWEDKCALLRQQAQTLSRPLRVVYAGNMITENGLPLFADALATKLRPIEIVIGISDNPLSVSRRKWYGQEDRHARVTYGYTSLSGIYNMAAIDRTIQLFYVNGFENEAGLDLYTNLLYVVKQEKFTEIAHMRTGIMARAQQQEAGVDSESLLYNLQTGLSREEGPHHFVYRNWFGGIMDEDPEGGIIAIRDMERSIIIMPAKFMGDINSNDEQRSSSLYDRYTEVGIRLGILTLADEVELDENLLKLWKVAERRVSGEAAEAQEEIFKLHARKTRYARWLEARRKRLNKEEGEPDVSDFKWLLPEAA